MHIRLRTRFLFNSVVPPKKAHKSPNSYGKSLSQPCHQLSESQNCFCILQKSGLFWSFGTPFWTIFYSKSYGLKFHTPFMLITFPFDIIFKLVRVNILKVFNMTDFRKLQILPYWAIFFHIHFFPTQQSVKHELMHFCNY
jgi:hypothetical protein